MITLWTDGSANPNPGPGGCAVIYEGKPVFLGKEKVSTNIRMEGMALIAAMEWAAGQPCEIVTDSEFWKDVLEKWAPIWEKHDWTKKTGEIKNFEMVRKAYRLYQEGKVKLTWTRGHVGTENNELADIWANRARKGQVGESGLEVGDIKDWRWPEYEEYLRAKEEEKRRKAEEERAKENREKEENEKGNY